MDYIKKMLIMSEETKGFGTDAVKGVVTIERVGTNTKCTVDIFNLKDINKGLYALGICADTSAVVVQRLGIRGDINIKFTISGELDLSGNLYAVLVYISEENIIPIIWGANNSKKLWQSNILDGFKSITRPKMFAGNIEKVELHKDKAEQRKGNDIEREIASYANAEKQEQSISRSVFSRTPNTPKSFSLHPNETLKIESIPKVTVAKVTKVIDEAIMDYDDRCVSADNYYPQGIKPRDIQNEAAASKDKKSYQVQTPNAYKEIPNELVDEYEENDVYKNANGKNAEENIPKKQLFENLADKYYIKPGMDNMQKEENEKEKFIVNEKIDQVYQKLEKEENQEQQEFLNAGMKYISSWGGYNNIKLKTEEENAVDKNTAEEKAYSEAAAANGKEKNNKDNKLIQYYLSVKDNLDKIFEQNPPEERLNELLPNTYWAKVELEKDQYYVVGLIGDEPDYIGYGVPGEYSVNPPKELEGYCKWLSIDENEPHKEGYWMMYQDAQNGESIKLDLI